ncbi:MAG: YceI family protein [Opitutales bacterium]|jgi:polyisoprenoid-binding protein YceI|tara:strand:- start:2482 stop:3084 length:603 start_codon:yes stop_codon:yes gene_type:complete
MSKFILLLTLPIISLSAKPIDFNFKDPKGVNNIIFQMDAPLESINGSADGISGNVSFDPKNPKTTKGTIYLNSKSLHVGNPLLKEHMHGDKWLDVEKFPEIKFQLSRLHNIRKEKNDVIADAKGKMSIKNITIEMNIPVKITYLKDLLIKRNRTPGDLLILRSKFIVKRDDFDIQKGESLEKVANNIEISLNLAGAAPKK